MRWRRQIRGCDDGAADRVGNHELLGLDNLVRNSVVEQAAVGRFRWLGEGDFFRFWHLIFWRQLQPLTTCGRRIAQTVGDQRNAAAVFLLVGQEGLHVGDVDIRDCRCN